MKLYKDSFGFWMNGELTPQGNFTLTVDNTTAIILRLNDRATIYNGPISGLLKEDGSAYTSKSDLLGAVYDFFVKASSGGGDVGVYSVNSKTGYVYLTKADLALGNVDNTSDANKPVSIAQQAAIDAEHTAMIAAIATCIQASQKGLANGVATLDATGALSPSQIPSSLLAGLKWKGVWNASTNSPTLTSTPSANGEFYRVSIAGTTSVPTGSSVTYGVGDWLISNGTSWQHIVNTFNDATTSTKGVIQLAGDLAGGAAAPQVAKIKGVTLPSAQPTGAGKYLRSTSTTDLEYASIPSADLPEASGSIKGVVTLAGDLGGTASLPLVKKINDWTVDNDPTAVDQVLAVTNFESKKLGYVAQSGGIDLTEENGVGYTYLKGDSSSTGSYRINGNVQPPTIEVCDNGQWNATELKISESTLYLGDNMTISSIGSGLMVRDLGNAANGFLATNVFTEAGTDIGLSVAKCKSRQSNVVTQGGELNYPLTLNVFGIPVKHTDYTRLVTNSTYKTGLAAATKPVTLRIYQGTSNAGLLMFKYTYPASKFTANTFVQIAEFKHVLYIKNRDYYVEFSSEAVFSLDGNSNLRYRKIDYYELVDYVLSMPPTSPTFSDTENADMWNDGNNMNIRNGKILSSTGASNLAFNGEKLLPNCEVEYLPLANGVPASTGGKLYNDNGTLKWGAVPMTAGSVPAGGTSGKLVKFTGSTAVGDSIITELSGKIGINKATPTATQDVVGIAGTTLQNLNDGTRDRQTIDSTKSQMVAPAGANKISATDIRSAFADANRDRISADATGSMLISPDGTRIMKATNTNIQKSVDGGATWSDMPSGADLSMTDWQAYTPTLTATTTSPTPGTGYTIKGLYKLVGKTLHLKMSFSQTVAGSAGSGVYKISLPNTYTIDLTKVSIPTSLSNTSPNRTGGSCIPLGFGIINDSSLLVLPITSTAVCMYFNTATNIGLVGSSLYNISGNTNLWWSFTAEIPVL